MRKALKTFLLALDRLLPIFPKDNLYSYDFETDRIDPLSINRRKYEMQYWCDFDKESIVSRYTRYINNKECGILFHNVRTSKLTRGFVVPNETFTCPRLLGGELLLLEKKKDKTNRIFFYETRKSLLETEANDFDVFIWKGQWLLVTDGKLYRIDDAKRSATLFGNLCVEGGGGRVLSEFTFCESGEKAWLACRLSDNNPAIGTKIALFSSPDLVTWTQERIVVDSSASELKRVGIDGVGFPTLRDRGKGKELYFSGYWGRHLLKNKTLSHWNNYSSAPQ